ncbi:MJ1255/VC2487 family glycosyltransferase [Methanococcus voltae]|uniref:Glycosyltransferase 28 domain protein n=1 Tax=Methanococcus voltae (strain ATCC BAA-1334 / A3) TaxID=456320 RepID=D7DR30_METV3|nr:MJ1255/VC2487 family glycosyltransferase [Methanococcus voltae]MCS3900967.1 uncharacterized protein (TIGR00661 family) [Methanococcus voltae]
MKVLISVCGEGFGHTTRCIALGKELSKKHDVKFVAYGKSKDFIELSKYEVLETYPEIKLSGKNGKFDIKRSMFNTQYHPTKAVKRELQIIKDYNPDLVISDCKYSTILASKISKKPYYIITNQNATKTQKKEKYIVYPVMKVLNAVNKSAEKLIIPDLPAPYTICEYNLKMINNLRFSGPLIRYDVGEDENEYSEDYILSVIGGFEYRLKILELINEISKKTGLKVKLVCGSHEVAKKLEKNKGKNVEIIPVSTEMDKLIKKCSMIVCHGGHSTLMEAVSFGKPIITIPDLDHPEQENNALKIQELKCGIALNYKILEKELEPSIMKLKNDKTYSKNAKKLREIALKYDGKEKLIEELEDSIL